MLKNNPFWGVLLNILWLLPGVTAAQPSFELPQLIGKLSLAHFLDPVLPSVQLGLEHRLEERLYLHHQAGYLFGWRSTAEIGNFHPNGFRLRSGVRRYFLTNAYQREKTFVEFSLGFTYANMRLEHDFCRFDCAYFQRIAYNRQHAIFTTAVDYGAVNYITKQFLLELALSAGLRFGNIRYTYVPPDAALANGALGWFLYNPGEPTIPLHFSIRLKLGYVLQ